MKNTVDFVAVRHAMATFQQIYVAKTIEIPGGFSKRPMKSWVGRFDSFSLGGETVKGGVRMQVADLFVDDSRKITGSILPMRPTDTPEVLLGADFFRSHRVLIANSQGRVYFSPIGGSPFLTRAEAVELPSPKQVAPGRLRE